MRHQLTLDSRAVAADTQTLQARLEAMYRLDVLHPDFRGLVPVSYLYKYISSGITDRLTGADGAYAQYLMDERADRIVHKLDVVIGQLQTVITNQRHTLHALHGLEATLRGIHDSLNEMSRTMQLTAAQIETLTKTQVEANVYLRDSLPKLNQIRQGIDIVATHSHVQALNDYRVAIENDVDAYTLRYPS